MRKKINIVWLKRDLRLQDHEPLWFSENSELDYLILYIFEPNLINYGDTSLIHYQFIYESIYKMNIQSIIIEGGTKTINHFLSNNLWDTIRVFKSNVKIGKGINAPSVNLDEFTRINLQDDILYEFNRLNI